MKNTSTSRLRIAPSVRRSSRTMRLGGNPGVVGVVVTYHGPTPFDTLDFRVASAIASATVRKLPDGTYRAETPSIPSFYSEGSSRREALAELREDARWLLADPIRFTFVAKGKEYVAEVLAERHGGYSATVPELPGCCTCGDTMDELRKYLVEAAEGWLDATEEWKAANA